MKICDLMEDWNLLDFEVKLAKACTKAIFLCTEEAFNRTHRFYHTNGMTFMVMQKYKMSLKKFNSKMLDKFDIRPSVISASCEHPEFYTWTYDGYCSSAYRSAKDALGDYLERHPELGLDMNTEYYVAETKFYDCNHEWQQPSEKRSELDERRLKGPHSSYFGRYNY